MHEQYNATLQKLKEMKKEYEWDKSIGIEFAGVADDSALADNSVTIAAAGR